MLYPDRTFSFFPAYLAGYLAALTLLLRDVDLRRPPASLTRGLALLGRRSLFVFVAQYFVVQTLPAILGHRWMSMRALLVFLPFAVITVFMATVAWDWLRSPVRARPAGRTAVP
jgi:hypothetical protein